MIKFDFRGDEDGDDDDQTHPCRCMRMRMRARAPVGDCSARARSNRKRKAESDGRFLVSPAVETRSFVRSIGRKATDKAAEWRRKNE